MKYTQQLHIVHQLRYFLALAQNIEVEQER